MFRIKACEGIYHYLSLKLISSHFYFRLFYSTFNLPNLTNRFLEGNGTGYIQAGLPNITGSMQFLGDGNTGFWGDQSTNSAIYSSGSTNASIPGGGVNTTKKYISFNASYSNSIYGKSTTVQPSTCKCYFVIKY